MPHPFSSLVGKKKKKKKEKKAFAPDASSVESHASLAGAFGKEIRWLFLRRDGPDFQESLNPALTETIISARSLTPLLLLAAFSDVPVSS